MLSFLLFLFLLTCSLFTDQLLDACGAAADSFNSTPPLATLAPRLAYGLGVVEFPGFLFLVIGSLFERRSTAGSLASNMPPIGADLAGSSGLRHPVTVQVRLMSCRTLLAFTVARKQGVE